MRFLVAGVTGNVGGEVAARLVDAGHHVSGVVRDPDVVLPSGIDPVVGDLEQPDGLQLGEFAYDAAFLLPGYRDMDGLVAAVRRAGAGRLVLLSGLSAGSGDSSNEITAMMERSERAVKQAPGVWTVVRPTAFMSNCLRWSDQLATGDLVTLPFPHVASALTHPADIADVVAAALESDEHAGSIHLLSGPQALTPEEQVAIVGRVLNRPLRFVPQSDEAAWDEMTAHMPRRQVEALFDFYVRGSLDESIVYPTITEVTGAPARTLSDWVDENRSSFPPPFDRPAPPDGERS